MITKQESVAPIDFEGLRIYDFTAGRSTSASFAVIDVPAGTRHRQAYSQRSDKYYYLVSGELYFSIAEQEQRLSAGSFCLVLKGQRFSYQNRSAESVQLILVHVPSFDLESEVFIDERQV